MAMTIKVMLVDDDLLVRLGIKSLIDWERHDFEFIGDASDGEKALELMGDRVPDILLTDIVMPRMNGLELIEAVKSRYPETVIIVLSSHNEFEYVRQAMKLGVEDYMLKTSLKPPELLNLLEEASSKVVRLKAQRAGEAGLTTPKQRSRASLAGKLQAELATDRVHDDAVVESNGPELRPDSYLLVLKVRHLQDGRHEPTTVQLLKHLVVTEWEDALECDPVSVGNRELVALLRGTEERPLSPEAIANGLMTASKQLLGISLRAETHGPAGSWSEVRRLYAKAIATMPEPAVREPSRDDIRKLLEYLHDNFGQELSLKEAADMVNMSESYLSTLFKRETGKGFTDWINGLRIDMAARLLVDTDMPSFAIAERVGYENVNYFGRIFKKIKGVSPQAYRSMHRK